MTLYCGFQGCREACIAVENAAKRRGVELHKRPWNLYDSENCPWWLIPSGEWPAYRHGKFFFDVPEGQSNVIRCGVYIEKGLGPKCRGSYKPGLIMEPDWAWFRLQRNLEGGEVEALILKTSRDLNTPVQFRIDIGIVQEREDFDRNESSFPHDSYLFQFQSHTGSFALTSSKIGPNLFHKFAEAMSINDLSRYLIELGREDWFWVDVYIGLQFNTEVPSGTALDKIWSADTIWDKFLYHFVKWL